jgi:cytochrome c-type biogenesis protein
VIILGLHIMGLFRLPFLQKHLQFKEVKTPKGVLGPFLLGMAFALGWSPCTGPILASILAYASTQQHIAKGILLLAVYSSGLAVPFLLFALLFGYAMKTMQRFHKLFRMVEIASGLVLIALGIVMLKGGMLTALA